MAGEPVKKKKKKNPANPIQIKSGEGHPECEEINNSTLLGHTPINIYLILNASSHSFLKNVFGCCISYFFGSAPLVQEFQRFYSSALNNSGEKNSRKQTIDPGAGRM